MIWLQDADFTLYNGDALEVLRTLPDESVDCCVTSPPYWGLRDYSVEGQLGLEPTPEEYVTRMVEVFREVRRVLAKHGTCWVNMGDSYATGGSAGGQSNSAASDGESVPGFRHDRYLNQHQPRTAVAGLKVKDLVGAPWRLAFALQADGWYLRSDIIWSKPNPMPESVTDRPTKAHEYVFLLTKSSRYFFDQEAVREAHSDKTWFYRDVMPTKATGNMGHRNGLPASGSTLGTEAAQHPSGRNIRSVWEIATQPFPEAHFATFPEELVRRCLLAGCPEQVCGECGKARERMVERESAPTSVMTKRNAPTDGLVASGMARVDGVLHGKGQKLQAWRDEHPSQTLGFTDCGHNAYRPGIVLDPFMGSGTTALVARKHGRRCVGIELSAEYCELIQRRTQQLSLLAVES